MFISIRVKGTKEWWSSPPYLHVQAITDLTKGDFAVVTFFELQAITGHISNDYANGPRPPYFVIYP